MNHIEKNSVEPTVLIEGQPTAIARRSSEGNGPAMPSGEPSVLIAGHPAVSLDGHLTSEHCPVSGKPTVLVAGRPATGE